MMQQTFARAARFADLQGVSLDDPARPFVYPPDLTDERRRELLAGLENGTFLAIRGAALVFREGQNHHDLELDPKNRAEWERLADSAGVPLLRNHEQWETRSRVGDVLAGKVGEDEGKVAVFDLFEIRDPQTAADYVRGLLDTFSVGIDFVGSSCSLCGGSVVWGETSCGHIIGQSYEEGRATRYVNGVKREELSFVNFGAVPETGLRAVFNRRENTMTTALFGALSDLLNAAIDRVASAGDQDRAVLVNGLAAAAELDEATTAQLLAGEQVTLSEEQITAIAGYLGEDPEQIEDAQAQDAEGADDDTNDNDSQDQGQEPGEDAMSAAERQKFAKRLKELEERTQRAEKAAFDAAFNTAVAEGKTSAAMKGEEEKIFRGTYNGDVALYSARFAKMPSNPAYGSQAFGGNGGQPAAPEDSDAPEFTGRRGQPIGSTLAAAAVRRGYAQPENFKTVFGEGVEAPKGPRSSVRRLFG